MKTIKANCYYRCKCRVQGEEKDFIIYTLEVKKLHEGWNFAAYSILRKIWSVENYNGENDREAAERKEYTVKGFPMENLSRISEKEALLKITAWML